ncbi:MAG: sigma-54-dependent Fis family transcriptional regulator [Deltaproteobacteria bacterium]|nr:sigma-54-dependent Fis family transcriptional regulator [Deltaproteobacteria bacterium]
MTTAPTRHLLVVDDQAQVPRLIAALLGEGYRVDGAASAASALAVLEDRLFDVVLTDLAMTDIDGIELIRRARRRDPDTPFVVFTAQASVESAVAAMREGAFDYLRKTASSSELRAAVDRAIQHGSLSREVRRLRSEVERARGTSDVIGQSRIMRDLMSLVERVAPSDASVLILGESGTGKELLARTIHRMSHRRDGPFVAFDCSALAPSLLESELFGHEKGAFTGAGRARRGLFREASGGTLFLDEIGDIAPEVQNKLLRVLQEREIKPVGGDSFVKIDVRVLAATNKDLRSLVARGSFREDLFFRLAVVPIHVPPLRERREDIPLLSAHLLSRRRAPGHDKRWPTRLSSGALAKLASYPWPGNIRELENVLWRAAILSTGDEIVEQDLPALETRGESRALLLAGLPAQGKAPGRKLKEIVEDAVRAVERQAIRDALIQCGGSPTRAARLLCISRASIYNKMKEHGIVG